jgi:hypothetical protein
MSPQAVVHTKIPFVSFLFFICVMIISSCSGNEKGQPQEITVADDSVQTVKSIASEDSTMIFNNKADNWISSSIKSESVDWNRFHLEEFWSDDSLQSKAFQPEEEFYRDYTQVLRWSPDSSYVLDLGSYGSVKVKDKAGNTRIEGGEPDTEVSIIYPKQKNKVRLLFFGPSTTIVDGRWLASSQVAVLGLYDENGDNHPDTLMWIINAKDKFFRKYRWE